MIYVRSVAVKNSSKMRSSGENFTLESYPGHVERNFSNHKSKTEQPGLTLSWNGLSVYCIKKSRSLLKSTTSTKKLVSNVTGVAKAGTLTALIGASGAGKTTLLSALAQRNSGGLVVEGDVRVNGHIIGSRIRKLSAFLHQHDLFFPAVTVYEHMVFYARLKLDRRLSQAEIKDKVLEILRQVGLLSVVHRQVGTSGEHYKIFLSGGERRRLSFATELLSNPDLFFCDEITSGLDSYSTLNIITILKEMAANHQKTIICAIHQPSSQLVDLFDNIIILAESRTAFIGSTKAGIEFLKEQGHQCPHNYNPADFFIKILAVTSDDELNSRKRVRKICDAYVSSDMAIDIDSFIAEEIYKRRNDFRFKINFLPSDAKGPNWFTRLLLVTYRYQVDIFRNKQYVAVQLIRRVVMALLTGLVFSGSLSWDQAGIQSWEGFFFSIAMQNIAHSLFSYMPKFHAQYPLFIRDYENGLVSSMLFYSAMMLAWFPLFVLESFLGSSIFYLLAGAYISFPVFIDSLYVLVLTSVVSLLCGSCFAASIDSFELSSFLSNELLFILNVLSGVYMNLRSVPVYLQLFEFFSWPRYTLEILTVKHIQDSTMFSCTNSTVIDLPCFHTGEEVLDYYGYRTNQVVWDYTVMYALMMFFFWVGYAFFFRRVIKFTTV